MELKRKKSPVNYEYITFNITKSRINKGLLAIPKSLAIEYFPREDATINVCFDESNKFEAKKYSSFLGSTKEARIGGMKEWFRNQKIKDREEIVIQVIDKNELKFRIIPENSFIDRLSSHQKNFDKSGNENEAAKKLENITHLTKKDISDVVLAEVLRLSKLPVRKRKCVRKTEYQQKESIPSSLRLSLEKVYVGRCQLTDFTFMMTNGRPYFEVHHINSDLGNHIKNLLVVCPNVHAQFTYSKVSQEFDEDDWLLKVLFNGKSYRVNQKIKEHEKEFYKRVYV